MDIRQIEYFMLIYETGSFSRAAEKAKIAQPALSMQIRRLEDEFGIKFFERNPKGVQPTIAGRRLYERCIPIAKHFALALQDMTEIGDGGKVTGDVRIGLPGSFNRGLLPRILTPFLESYPNVNVAISEAYTGTLVEWVKGGHVDFAIGSRPKTQRGLVQRLIYRDKVVLMSGTPLNGANFTPIDLTQSEPLKLILPSQNQSYGGVVRDWIADGTIKVERIIEINGTISSSEFALRSDWAVVAPFVSVANEVAQEEPPDNFFIYPILSPSIPFDLYVVYDERRPLSVAAKKFIERIELELRWLKTVWLKLKMHNASTTSRLL
ncbi:LysR family transcriptional regulator [Bradyrhizobium canariense]|uniref:Transcriptional regulator, LysR family n=1 Tax=Bradyrhizobium canariense TaxID=255045 RepID=A0A1H1XP59_9BRAD|nr:LysR family transcriptional regulator [Bradyrhizobium canariense]SDT10990.1 transcriptional regulator, LysR family [Bradyrhizobium canariense]